MISFVGASSVGVGGSGSNTINHDFGSLVNLVIRTLGTSSITNFASLVGTYDGNEMVFGAQTAGASRCMAALHRIAEISAGAKACGCTWTGGGDSQGFLLGYTGQNISHVSSTPFSGDGVATLGGAIPTQPGDLVVGTLKYAGTDGAAVAGGTPRVDEYSSQRNKVFEKIAGAGATTGFIFSGQTMNTAVLVVDVYREAATPITATHGDQDVAYGEDPGFTGNVDGANLKAGAISIPLTLGASSTNSAPTFNLEDFTTFLRDNPWLPFSGTQLKIEITSDDGGDTAVTRNITLALPADFAQVTLAGVVNTSGSAFYQSSIYSGPDFTPEDNAQMVYDNQFNTSVAADGALTTDRNGTEIKAWIYLPTPNLLVFYPFTAPAQTVITIDGSPATLEPSTQYTATVINGTSVCDGGQTFNSGTGYDVTIDSADVNTITFTTSASLPASSPVQFKFNFPTA